MNALLVDDEAASRFVLRDLLRTFCPGVTVCGEADSVDSAHQAIRSLHPDLVFLDVQMPHGNGFSLLSKFDTLPFQVIFVTGYDQYAINAIRFSALDYLMKPVDIGLLQCAVEKAARKNTQLPAQHMQVVNLIYNAGAAQQEQRLTLHHNDSVRVVQVSEIMYIEGQVNYAHVFTVHGEKILTSRTVKELEDFLRLSGLFIRIHRGAVINTNYIYRYSKGDPFLITMKDGRTFEASRRKKAEVLAALKN